MTSNFTILQNKDHKCNYLEIGIYDVSLCFSLDTMKRSRTRSEICFPRNTYWMWDIQFLSVTNICKTFPNVVDEDLDPLSTKRLSHHKQVQIVKNSGLLVIKILHSMSNLEICSGLFVQDFNLKHDNGGRRVLFFKGKFVNLNPSETDKLEPILETTRALS